VDPLCERDRYRGELGTLRAHVTSATTMRPERPILFPGDAEAIAQETRQRDGIDIEASTWAQLAELARRVGVEPPS
jgi:LDH2 family malate/lactate/ureidoglycolate dehydrogenase